MSLKTLLNLFLRGLALWMFLKATGPLLAGFVLAMNPVTDSSGLVFSRSGDVIANIAFGTILVLAGSLLFRYSSTLYKVFGRDLDGSERLEVVNAEVLVVGIYTVFGIGLVAFSLPQFLSDLVRLQMGSYSLSASRTDASSVALHNSLLENGLRILIGGVLLRYARRLPPLGSLREVSDVD